MHRFLLRKCPCLEEPLRNKSDVEEEEEMPGVSGVYHGASSISVVSMNAQNGPRRPKLQKFPPCMFGVQQRSFCKSWLGQFAWLEYNATKVLLAV